MVLRALVIAVVVVVPVMRIVYLLVSALDRGQPSKVRRIGRCRYCDFSVATIRSNVGWADGMARAYVDGQMRRHSFDCKGLNQPGPPYQWDWDE